ncbi:MAG: hypothetical protein KDJ47_04960 [Hyphomicrobiaceae bacterium]|nr:hypothetical protein [Hyphomicrobiaceae bacterium]
MTAPAPAKGRDDIQGHVVIAHGVLDATRPDEQDTLDQVREVAGALARLGCTVDTMAVSLDLSPLAGLAQPDENASDDDGAPTIFNLVEALDGDGRLIHLAPAVMEHAGLAFTGSGAAAIAVTTDKRLTKRLLASAGLPVPADWDASTPATSGAQFIVKSLTEDASFGIDSESVVPSERVGDEIAVRAARFGGHWFAEAYIAGREFNLSLLDDESGTPQVLPIAEIAFEGYDEDRPRIVDYEAKWQPDSFAYNNTPRHFIDAVSEGDLADELERLARSAWHTLGLAGYGRIDFRVDATGRAYILEANANPCLSPDAGFAAAARQAGMTYDELIGRILACARRHGGAHAVT